MPVFRSFAIVRLMVAVCCIASLPAARAGGCASLKVPSRIETPPPAAGGQCGTSPAVQTMTLLDPATYPAALCNDGTPGAYRFRPGVGEGRTRWVIDLEGGRKCLNDGDCQTRAATRPWLVTSNNIGNKPLQGIMSASNCTNPTFYDANIVKVHYCSSDYWQGATVAAGHWDAGNASGTWNFQGRAIAAAVVAEMQLRGLGQARDILLAGSASSGLGMTSMFNDLRPMMPAGARLLMLDDAGYTIDVDGYDPNGAPPDYTSSASPTPGENILMEGAALWGGRGDVNCEASGISQGQPYDVCRSSSFLVNGLYIPVPVLDLESLIDSAQSKDNNWVGPYKPGTPNYGYANWFATQMGPSLTASGAANSVFAPYKLVHTLTDKDVFFTTPYGFPSGTMTPQQAVAPWYAAPCARPVQEGVLD